jgi:hypothetical protein
MKRKWNKIVENRAECIRGMEVEKLKFKHCSTHYGEYESMKEELKIKELQDVFKLFRTEELELHSDYGRSCQSLLQVEAGNIPNLERVKYIVLSFHFREKESGRCEKALLGLKKLVEKEDLEKMRIDIRVNKDQLDTWPDNGVYPFLCPTATDFLFEAIKTVLEERERKKDKEIELKISFLFRPRRKNMISEWRIMEYFEKEMRGMSKKGKEEFVEKINSFFSSE